MAEGRNSRNARSDFGQKRQRVVVDSSGNPVYNLKNDGVYSLGGNYLGSVIKGQKGNCRKLSEFSRYVTDGTNLYYEGRKVGRIKKDYTKAIVISLVAILLIIALILALVFTTPKKDVVPTFTVTDKDGVWQDEQTIDLFGARIHPGASGTYIFVIENTSEVALAANVSLIFGGTQEDVYLPIKYTLLVDGKPYETEKRLDGTATKLTLQPNSKTAFTLGWEWTFEDGNDASDTVLGELALKYKYKLTITAQSASDRIGE